MWQPLQCPGTAVVEVGPRDSTNKIAGLSVLDRLVISLNRAGCERIIVVTSIPISLPRATALGIKVEIATVYPAVQGPVLAAADGLLATADDIRRVRESGGRLVAGENSPKAFALCASEPPPLRPSAPSPPQRGRGKGRGGRLNRLQVQGQGEKLPLGVVSHLSAAWQADLDQVPAVIAVGPAARVIDSASARRAERIYWASLTSSSDGLVDRHFNRPVGRILSRLLVHTNVSPNQVSVSSSLIGLASAALFAMGTAGTALAGALCFQLSAIVDCVDGDLARALYKQSAFGKWLDIVGDQVVHVAVFLGLGVGLWRSGSTAPVVLLGMVAAAGVVMSFVVILQTLRRPALRGQNRMQKLIDATTNRDFSVLLILFALGGVLDWFLWLAAIGSHVFWLVALTLQIQERRRIQPHEPAH